jgi:hypothetical protein
VKRKGFHKPVALRNYNGYKFDFEKIATELFRITKIGDE